MGPFSVLTEQELEQMCDRAYDACMAYWDALDARNDVWAADWKCMKAAALEQAELHRSLSVELARRTAERAHRHLDTAESLADQLVEEILKDARDA